VLSMGEHTHIYPLDARCKQMHYRDACKGITGTHAQALQGPMQAKALQGRICTGEMNL